MVPIAEKIAVIGAGKIGQALIKALVSSGYENIIATARRQITLRNVSKLGVETTIDNDRAVREAVLIILSVKPYHLPNVLQEVRSESWSGKTVVSLLAGVRIATLREFIKGAEVYRAMPNINSLVRKSSTAIAYNGQPGPGKVTVERIFRTVGKVYWVPEELLDAWTGLVGSGPAYIAEIVDGLILGALSIGVPRDLAFESILDVLEGTAELLRSTQIHPSQMRDEVTTPAGTTIRGLAVLESESVKAALIKAVEAATQRSKEVSVLVDKQVRETLSRDHAKTGEGEAEREALGSQ